MHPWELLIIEIKICTYMNPLKMLPVQLQPSSTISPHISTDSREEMSLRVSKLLLHNNVKDKETKALFVIRVMPNRVYVN